MKRTNVILASVLAFVAASSVCGSARAADYYVAPGGNDANPGTLQQPFGSVERAERAAAPGDTVYLRGGVYRFSGTQATVGVALTKSGASGRPIRYFAYEAEVPVFDLFELKPQARLTGIDVRCDWVHVRGIELRGVRQVIVGDSWGVRIRGSHNVIERLNVHDCEAPGIFITSGASNLILNCDAHHNYDPLENGGNADGFGCHSTGGDNVMRGCRAYENSDDGFDFINAPGTCIAEGSWAFRNGFIPDTNMTGANGAGFKSGGFGNPPNVPASGVPRHVVRASLAFGNRAIGFYANYHPGGIDFFNNTAFDNPANFDMRTTSGATSSHKLRNNIAAGSGRAIVSFNGGSDSVNSWTLPVTVSNADFMSMDKILGLAPRQADGSLPSMSLMRLVAGSDLIDRGEDVGLAFTGSAPDLGAYEWSTSSAGDSLDAGLTDATIATDGAVRAPMGDGAQGSASGGDAGQGKPPVGSVEPMASAADAGIGQATDGMAPTPGTNSAPDVIESDDDRQSEGGGCSMHTAHSSSNPWLALLAALWIVGARLRDAERRSRSARGRARAKQACADDPRMV